MDRLIVSIYQNYKKPMIVLLFFIEFIIFLIKIHFKGVNFWSLIGALVFFIIAVDLIYNGSYLLISKISNKSDISEYYVRFLYILSIYSFSIYCIIYSE
jgi:hypothetical protein